eukprot:TRINITY_DN17947_c0_g1_i3.p1 TRINITY_DN17947_c0_g1~~TRINITY_DN17947_c0_g1_i3.p1  ORF type:complete len:493 (-),score=84.71 TRINITY_DN17947_c0_g1_i3:32-1510(-)
MFSRSEVEFFSSEGCFFHWAWEEKPDFIVFGFLLTHVAMIISEALEIPIVGFSMQPLREIEPVAPRTVLDELFGPVQQVINGPRFISVLQQVMELLPDRFTLRDLRTSRGLAPCPANILSSNQQAEELHAQGVPIIVPISPAALGEQARTLQQNGLSLTDFIFLRLGAAEKRDEEVAKFVDEAKSQGRQVVAMTFSSMPVGEGRMLDIAAEICRNCMPPIDVGQEQLKHHPAVIAMVGGQPQEGEVSELVRSMQQERRLLVLRRPVDFGNLFPKVDAAILHGGLGVTSEALRAGIPVITSGILLMDQRYWAARLSELGVGSQGVPVDELLLSTGRTSHGGMPTTRVVDLMQQALDQRQGTETWRNRAKQVQQELKEAGQGDEDGLQRNAAAVFRAGMDLDHRAIVRQGYNRHRGCLRVCCRQNLCLLRCLERTARWLLCSQVPACARCWLQCALWCLCCKPLRYLFFWCFPRDVHLRTELLQSTSSFVNSNV